MDKNILKQEPFVTDNYNSMLAPRYCGITTFMRTPLVRDPSGNTALVAATMMYEILCILAEAVAQRKKW
ncbi:MAG: hypothetical protein U9O41_03940 [Candidatus Aerophobetes bacterium]|nr:hypothetical protein [Candidatus Aerophobetes bacterium]